MDIQVPRDRDGSFDSELIPKGERGVSAIEDKMIAMYAKGMSQRDISLTVENIYGFSISYDMFSDITDSMPPELEEWQVIPLNNCYAFVFVDCMYTTIRNQYETKKYAVHTILGYTMEGGQRYTWFMAE